MAENGRVYIKCNKQLILNDKSKKEVIRAKYSVNDEALVEEFNGRDKTRHEAVIQANMSHKSYQGNCVGGSPEEFYQNSKILEKKSNEESYSSLDYSKTGVTDDGMDSATRFRVLINSYDGILNYSYVYTYAKNSFLEFRSECTAHQYKRFKEEFKKGEHPYFVRIRNKMVEDQRMEYDQIEPRVVYDYFRDIRNNNEERINDILKTLSESGKATKHDYVMANRKRLAPGPISLNFSLNTNDELDFSAKLCLDPFLNDGELPDGKYFITSKHSPSLKETKPESQTWRLYVWNDDDIKFYTDKFNKMLENIRAFELEAKKKVLVDTGIDINIDIVEESHFADAEVLNIDIDEVLSTFDHSDIFIEKVAKADSFGRPRRKRQFMNTSAEI